MRTTTVMRNVKCVVLSATLLALGCHHPHHKQYEPVKREVCEVPDLIGDVGPFVVSGSATPIDSTDFVKIFSFGTHVAEMLAFFKSRGIPPEIDDAGHAKLYDSMKLRNAVAEYLGILDRRITVIANNLANVHTLEYQSKVLIVHEDGATSVEPNERPFPLEYAPEDPLAIKEGPDKGHIRLSNVHVAGEQIDLIFTRRAYRLARDIMHALYDRPRCKCCSQRTSVPVESP